MVIDRGNILVFHLILDVNAKRITVDNEYSVRKSRVLIFDWLSSLIYCIIQFITLESPVRMNPGDPFSISVRFDPIRKEFIVYG